MKLIYLDTSNFSLLSKSKVSEQQNYISFVRKWKNSGYTLAFTVAHLDELLRLEFANERNTRFEILEDLLPFKFESKLMDKEILSAFIEKKVVEARFNDIDLFPQVFSQKISNSDDLELLKGFDFDGYRQIIDLYYSATKISWEANAQSTRKKTDKLPRLSDLPNEPMTPEMKQLMETSLENMKTELPKNFQNFPDEVIDLGQSFVADIMKTFVEKSDQSGFREAFSEFIGANTNDSKTLKNSINHLMENLWFNLFLDNFIEKFLKIDDVQKIQHLKSLINLKDCPGMWLSEQVKNQLKLAKDSKASNEKDI